MKIRTGDEVVISDGSRSKTMIVLFFTKHHVALAAKNAYENSIANHGEYRRAAYGYATFPIRKSYVQKSFWEMLRSVNGVEHNATATA
jgi:hypothetical protein